MDKPRSWPPPNLIIDRPDQQKRGHRVLFGTLTLVFWMAWVYLWLPLITLLGWLFGVQQFYEIMIQQGGLVNLKESLIFYSTGIFTVTGSLILWATYNWVRFSGKDRRQTRPVSSGSAAMAKFLKVSEAVIVGWQRACRISVTHHDDGRLASVEVLEGDQRIPALLRVDPEPFDTNDEVAPRLTRSPSATLGS